MCHLVTIATQVRDPVAITAACAGLRLAPPLQRTVRLNRMLLTWLAATMVPGTDRCGLDGRSAADTLVPMVKRFMPVPIIDVFAGPGGLGEGFSALTDRGGSRPFRIALSIEKDPVAHRTLLLRSFFRQFEPGRVPETYYERLRQRLTTAELFAAHPLEAAAARAEAWNATLGDANSAPLDRLRPRIREALGKFSAGEDRWMLIGGPPCQAYSLVGRSRNRGKAGYRLEEDPRARLYLEYLQIIGDCE